MRYRISCDGQILGTAQDPELAQALARYHAKIVDLLDWHDDPTNLLTVKACVGAHTYKVEVIPLEERGA